MPYISDEMREQVAIRGPMNAGELNYSISKLINDYLNAKSEIRYADFNEVIGVLECAKQELYRTQISHYEDKAIEKNGDVYTISP